MIKFSSFYSFFVLYLAVCSTKLFSYGSAEASHSGMNEQVSTLYLKIRGTVVGSLGVFHS